MKPYVYLLLLIAATAGATDKLEVDIGGVRKLRQPLCNGSLSYDTSTHTFSCGAGGGGVTPGSACAAGEFLFWDGTNYSCESSLHNLWSETHPDVYTNDKPEHGDLIYYANTGDPPLNQDKWRLVKAPGGNDYLLSAASTTAAPTWIAMPDCPYGIGYSTTGDEFSCVPPSTGTLITSATVGDSMMYGRCIWQGNITPICNNLAVPSSTQSGSAQTASAAGATTRQWATYGSSSSGTSFGLSTTANNNSMLTLATGRTEMHGSFKFWAGAASPPVAATGARFAWGLTANASSAYGSDTPVLNGAWFRYNTTTDGSGIRTDDQIYCCTSDGTSAATCQASGVNKATGDFVDFRVIYEHNVSATFELDGVTVCTATANLPSTDVALYMTLGGRNSFASSDSRVAISLLEVGWPF